MHVHTQVELAEEAELESVSIWAELTSTGASGYPAFKVRSPIAPLRVLLLDSDRDVIAEQVSVSCRGQARWRMCKPASAHAGSLVSL